MLQLDETDQGVITKFVQWIENIGMPVLVSLGLVVLIATGLRAFEETVVHSMHRHEVSDTIQRLQREYIGIPHASAATRDYSAKVVSQSVHTVHMNAGADTSVEVRVKNTGNMRWEQQGDDAVFLSLRSESSELEHAWWRDSRTPARLKEVNVAPGETGTLEFAIRAPQDVGRYHETFRLMTHDAKIPGSTFKIHVKVGNPPLPYQAEISDTTCERLFLQPGLALTCHVTYENTGTHTWKSSGSDSAQLETVLPRKRTSSYQHAFWRTSNVLNHLPHDVAPGEEVTIAYAVEASTLGRYRETFGLVVDDEHKVVGSTFALHMKVYEKEEAMNGAPNAQEPFMRVGLFKSDDVIISANTPFVLKDENGKKLHEFEASDRVEINYKGGVYDITGAGWHKRTRNSVSVSGSYESIFEVENYENRPAWNTELNDNRFRYKLDVVYSSASNDVWVVNELPLEMYLRGIAETGNGNQKAFNRSLAIAARTYALFHILNPTKYANQPFILDATAASQVYRGYGYERRGRTFVDAVNATAGKVVMYDDEVVVTPYFSQSDGRTRAWDEVWYGEYPYLVSKEDPCCTERELLGHGVGMSAVGALYFADLGWSTTKILKYYYTGVSIKEYY